MLKLQALLVVWASKIWASAAGQLLAGRCCPEVAVRQTKTEAEVALEVGVTAVAGGCGA